MVRKKNQEYGTSPVSPVDAWDEFNSQMLLPIGGIGNQKRDLDTVHASVNEAVVSLIDTLDKNERDSYDDFSLWVKNQPGGGSSKVDADDPVNIPDSLMGSDAFTLIRRSRLREKKRQDDMRATIEEIKRVVALLNAYIDNIDENVVWIYKEHRRLLEELDLVQLQESVLSDIEQTTR